MSGLPDHLDIHLIRILYLLLSENLEDLHGTDPVSRNALLSVVA